MKYGRYDTIAEIKQALTSQRSAEEIRRIRSRAKRLAVPWVMWKDYVVMNQGDGKQIVIRWSGKGRELLDILTQARGYQTNISRLFIRIQAEGFVNRTSKKGTPLYTFDLLIWDLSDQVRLEQPNKPHKEVNEYVLSKLRKGQVPWLNWGTDPLGQVPTNYATRKPYSGVNRLLLVNEYQDCPLWVTKTQAYNKNLQIKEGSAGVDIYYSRLNIFWVDEAGNSFKVRKQNGSYYLKESNVMVPAYSVRRKWNHMKTTVYNLDTTSLPFSEVDLCKYNLQPLEELEIALKGIFNRSTVKEKLKALFIKTAGHEDQEAEEYSYADFVAELAVGYVSNILNLEDCNPTGEYISRWVGFIEACGGAVVMSAATEAEKVSKLFITKIKQDESVGI